MKLLKIWKKFVTNFLMGLKIWDEVGIGGPLFSNLQQVGDFSYFWSKSNLLPGQKRRMPTAGVHKPTFFSLRGPAKALHQRAREAREFVNAKISL